MSDDSYDAPEGIAVIGMAGRFPGAANLDQFWDNLVAGRACLTHFDRTTLLRAGLKAELVDGDQHVPVAGTIDGAEDFDAAFFGISRAEALLIDPQQRLFLEQAWLALEDAGYPRPEGLTAVYGGTSLNRYLLFNVMPNLENGFDPFQALLGADKDFLTTRVSYKLDLKGPSLDVQTACSSSLVAVHLACESLLSYESDLALAGGVGLIVPRHTGYKVTKGGILSPQGQCRVFDAAASGTVPGEGVGLVVLKRLADALADGDHVRAVILGSAINNDGADKTAYSAPSIDGQVRVIRRALTAAGLNPSALDFIECHGTGTALGDPIEVEALRRVLARDGAPSRSVALGSVKSNIGHLDAAAGIAGLIKAVLALEHGCLPASLHFEQANPEINFSDGLLHVNTAATPLRGDGPHHAGVSSFGMGGTNAHVVLQQAPPRPPAPPAPGPYQLTLSAKSETALRRQMRALADHLQMRPDQSLADVAYTLHVGRARFPVQQSWQVRDHDDAVTQLRHAAEAPLRAESVAISAPASGRRVSLPSDPFERRRFWLAADKDHDVLHPDALAADLSAFVQQQKQRLETPDPTTRAANSFWAEVDSFCGAWAAWTLQSMGWIPAVDTRFSREQAAAALGIAPRQQPYLFLLLDIWCRDAWLDRTEAGDFRVTRLQPREPFAQLDTLAVAYPEQQAPLAVLRLCLQRLPDMLRGHVHPLEALAPGGDLTNLHALYRGGPLIESVNRVVARTLRQIMQRSADAAPLRILEIGAGTGATSATVLPELDPQRVSYCFTDVSSHFLNRAKSRFAAYPFVEYALLDMEQPATSGALAGRRFDVILAANVLHAAADLPATLQRVADFAAPGALLCLLEGTTRSRFADLVFGGLAGWHAFKDGRTQLELDSAQWTTLLQTAPWQNPRALLPAGSGIQVFLAQRNDDLSVQEPKPPLKAAAAPHPPKKPQAVLTTTDRADLEKTIAAVWADVLQCPQPRGDDDFFDLGGDSLFALQVVDQIHKQTGCELSVTQLENAPTPAALAAWIARQQPEQGVVRPLKQGRAGAPLFLLPGGLGDVANFGALVCASAITHSVYGVAYARVFEQQPRSIADIAALIVPDIEKVAAGAPILLAGHSLGGWIAYECAALLQARGHKVNFLGLFDIHGLGSRFEQDVIDRGQGRDGAQFARLDRLAGGHQGATPANLANYQPAANDDLTVTLFKARDGVPRNRAGQVPPKLADDPSYGWKALVRETRIYECGGGHLSMFQPPHVTELAKQLTQAVNEAAPAT